jgi:hypothetical protein
MLSDDSRLSFFANRQVSACALPACAGGRQICGNGQLMKVAR